MNIGKIRSNCEYLIRKFAGCPDEMPVRAPGVHSALRILKAEHEKSEGEERQKRDHRRCCSCFFNDASDCRRYAPGPEGFAQVGSTDWCGEWEEK